MFTLYGIVMKTSIGTILVSILWVLSGFAENHRSEAELLRKSLVRISVTSQIPDYRTPWNPGKIRGAVGSGFIISGSRVMTNAHVVSNAKYISVDKDGSSQNYPARVLHIAHDCDLALLEIENQEFFDDTIPLDFGKIPELHSTVTAFGYPIGGERMSVTRGIVSRIEFQTYSHSGLDSHLTVQVDAAINPGNSGGPVMQNGKVVGVAFQGYSGSVAQNTGYMIPTPVINRFFGDIQDSVYDGYVELGIDYINLLNPSYRKKLNLPDDNIGVVVTNVLAAGSAESGLQANDVLLKIDGYPITSDGHINLDGEYLQMEEIVERKYHGDNVRFEILRKSKKMTVEVKLKGAWPYRILVKKYDQKPEFVLFSGLLFQPLSRDFLAAYKNKDLDVNYYYSHYISEEIYVERPQIIVLSDILPDPINTYCNEFVNAIVDEINDTKIRTLKDIAGLIDQNPSQFVIRMLGKAKPIVIEREMVAQARTRISTRYGVVADRYLKDGERLIQN